VPSVSAPKNALKAHTRSSTGGQADKEALNATSSEKIQVIINDDRKDASGK
jgi:hypothetical protein